MASQEHVHSHRCMNDSVASIHCGHRSSRYKSGQVVCNLTAVGSIPCNTLTQYTCLEHIDTEVTSEPGRLPPWRLRIVGPQSMTQMMEHAGEPVLNISMQQLPKAETGTPD